MLPFSTALPYPSNRQPVLARNCVATSHPLAAQAGLGVMKRGGNAVDAAIATAMTLTVVEPSGNGIGSDNFALIWAGGGLHGLNASGRSPALMTPDRYTGKDRVPFAGYDGVTVPGAPQGWVDASLAFGSMPLTEIARSAIDYARDGHPLSQGVGRSYAGVLRRYRDGVHEGFYDCFTEAGPAGRYVPGPGDTKTLPGHADTLQAIAETQGAAFYRGPLAQQMSDHSEQWGGTLRAEDLAQHESAWVRPMSMEYRGWRLHEIPPNGQGIAALIALGILGRFETHRMEPDEPRRLHLQIEAMKLAFRDAERYVADPALMDIDPAVLLDDEYLAERASQIDPDRTQEFGHGVPPAGGTVLLTTADADGTMVSFIQSNYTGFGSGVVTPGTGISLQNRGCCFTLEPGHPNALGPRKRPYHTIIPGFVTRDVTKPDGSTEEIPVMTFGVMGGFMQPQGHVQVLMRVRDHRQNPQAALDAPRFQIQQGRRVDLEPGFNEEVYETLEAMGHEIRRFSSRSASFGRGQAIYNLASGAPDHNAPDHDTTARDAAGQNDPQRPSQSGYYAASDSRGDGQAVGY
ncbi:MAG: gamma-glutamyltransferase family protein [Planctomycetota bacterium]